MTVLSPLYSALRRKCLTLGKSVIYLEYRGRKQDFPLPLESGVLVVSPIEEALIPGGSVRALTDNHLDMILCASLRGLACFLVMLEAKD